MSHVAGGLYTVSSPEALDLAAFRTLDEQGIKVIAWGLEVLASHDVDMISIAGLSGVALARGNNFDQAVLPARYAQPNEGHMRKVADAVMVATGARLRVPTVDAANRRLIGHRDTLVGAIRDTDRSTKELAVVTGNSNNAELGMLWGVGAVILTQTAPERGARRRADAISQRYLRWLYGHPAELAARMTKA